jgi:hypothetical protein
LKNSVLNPQKESLKTRLTALATVLTVVVPVSDRWKPMLTGFTVIGIAATAFQMQMAHSGRVQQFAHAHLKKLLFLLLCSLAAIVIAFRPPPQKDHGASVSLSKDPESGFGISGPFLMVFAKNFGDETAHNIKILTLMTTPTADKDYYFSASSFESPVLPGQEFTTTTILLTNGPGGRFEPPWPESLLAIEIRYSSERGSQVRTQFLLRKHQPQHPGAALLNADDLIHWAGPPSDDVQKYDVLMKQRLLAAEANAKK